MISNELQTSLNLLLLHLQKDGLRCAPHSSIDLIEQFATISTEISVNLGANNIQYDSKISRING